METTAHKALAAGLVAGAGGLLAALDHGLTFEEVLGALVIAGTAAAATWRVPNRRRSERRGRRRH